MPRKQTRAEREKRERFVEAFTGVAEGNAKKAAELAGYKDADKIGARLMREPWVQQAIERVRKEAEKAVPGIMTREERFAWWSTIIRGDPIQQMILGVEVMATPPMAARLKASELLGKAQGDFVERHEHKHVAEVRIVIPDNGRDPET